MLNAVYIIWLREMKKFVRDRSRLISSIAQPLIWLLLIGTGFGSAFGKVGDLRYIQFMFPGIIVMTLLFTSMFSAISIIWDREFGFLKEMLVAPISSILYRYWKIHRWRFKKYHPGTNNTNFIAISRNRINID